MTTAAELEALTRAAGNLACLASVADLMFTEVEAGQPDSAHELGDIVQALLDQARAVHRMAAAQWSEVAHWEAACAAVNQGIDHA